MCVCACVRARCLPAVYKVHIEWLYTIPDIDLWHSLMLFCTCRVGTVTIYDTLVGIVLYIKECICLPVIRETDHTKQL